MPMLNYQSAKDRHTGGFFRQLFGPSQKEVWAAVAEQVHARYEPGTWRHRSRVVAAHGPWQMTLDCVKRGKRMYTRVRAPFVSADGLRFWIYRRHLFTGIGEMLGAADIEIGVDPRFDHEFVIKSNDVAKVRRLLGNERLRLLIDCQPTIHFGVKDDEGWFGTTFPQGVDELYFECGGILRDHELLKGLFDLFAETLQQLQIQGSAHEMPPGVTL